jgi:hypothetical protein
MSKPLIFKKNITESLIILKKSGSYPHQSDSQSPEARPRGGLFSRTLALGVGMAWQAE